MCVYDQCIEPLELFATSDQWLTHMRESHATYWTCRAKVHQAFVQFHSERDFIEHMETEHPGSFTKSQMPFIARNSSRVSLKIFEACPFCARDTVDPEKHVAEHLRDIAFWLLPWPKHAAYDDTRDDQSWGKSTTFSLGTRQTIRDMKDLPEASFEDSSENEAIESRFPAGSSERLSDFDFMPEVLAQYRDFTPKEQETDMILSHFREFASVKLVDGMRLTATGQILPSRQCVFLVPYEQNLKFVGRKTLVEDMLVRLQRPKATLALFGLGGMG